MDAERIATFIGGGLGAAVAVVAGAQKALAWLSTSAPAPRATTLGQEPTLEERVRHLEGRADKMQADIGPLVKKATDDALDEGLVELVRRLNRAAKKAKTKGEPDGREDDDERRSSGA